MMQMINTNRKLVTFLPISMVVVFGIFLGLLTISLDKFSVIFLLFSFSLLVIAFRFPKVLVYSLILLFPIIAALPRGLIIQSMKIDEILIIGGIILTTFRYGIRHKFSKIDFLLILIFMIGITTALLGAVVRQNNIELFELLALGKWYLFYFLISNTFSNNKEIRRIIVMLLAISLPIAMLSIFQIQNLFSVKEFLGQIYYDTSAVYVVNGIQRATSTLGNWNALGGYAVLTGLLSLSTIQFSKTPWERLLALFSLISSLVLLVLAGSSNSIIGFICGCVIWFILGIKDFSRNKRVRSIFLLVTLIVILSTPFIIYMGKDVIQKQWERQTRVTTRTFVDDNTYKTRIPEGVFVRYLIAKDLYSKMEADKFAFLIGFGPGESSELLFPTSSAESGYVRMIFTFGIFYPILYIFLLYSIFRRGLRISSASKNGYWLGLNIGTTLIMSVIAIGIMIIIHSYHRSAGVAHYFWVMVGISAVVERNLLSDNLLEKSVKL